MARLIFLLLLFVFGLMIVEDIFAGAPDHIRRNTKDNPAFSDSSLTKVGIPNKAARSFSKAGSVPSSKIISISRHDEKNIKTKAQGAVSGFMNLLNVIATGLDLDVSQTDDLIRRSYMSAQTKIFFDSAVIVEDDLRKVDDPNQSKQKPAYSYLRDFEIFYKKTDSATVRFSNFTLSNVKQGKFLYIKVHYDHLFTGQSKISNEPYQVRRRVAELRVEKLNNKWKAWLVDVHYEDSSDLAMANDNDIPVVDDMHAADSLQIADSLSADEGQDMLLSANKSLVTDPLEKERLRRKNDSIRTYMAFRILIDSGKHALNDRNYIVAYQFFNEAENVVTGSNSIIRTNDRDFLETMIGETRRNIEIAHRTPEQNFKLYLQEALLKKNQRRYEQAIDFYNRALTIKPGEAAISAKVKELTIAINNLSRLDAKYMAGNYKDAIREYEKAIASDPSNSDYYVGRGKCYDRIKESKKALLDFAKAIEADANNIEAYKARAIVHERLKSIPEAIAAYTICTSIDKYDVAAFIKIADLNMQQDNAEAAMAVLAKGIITNPAASMLHYRRGSILQQQKQARMAIQAYNSAIRYDSINARLFFQRGLCNMEIQDVASAGFDFLAARRLGLEPDLNKQSLAFASEFYNSGLAQFRAGRLDVALSMFANARLIDPSFAGYHYQTGYVNFFLKKYAEAIENFTDAINLDSRYAAAYRMRGLAKYRVSDYRNALPDLERAVLIEPNIAETYKYFADVLIKLKEYKKAISKYNEALDAGKSRKYALSDSLRADLYFGKGFASLYTGDFKHALEYFKQSIKIEKHQPQVYYYRGVTYLKQKEYGDASESIEKALTYEPLQPIWNTTLGEIYYLKGKYDKALELFNRAIDEDTALTVFPEPVYHRANAYFRMNDFQAALNDYEKIRFAGLDKNYDDFNTSVGHAFLYMDQPDSALVYFNKENKRGLNALSLYGTAIVYVLKAQPDLAFKYLDKTMTAGKVPKAMITKDKRLTSIRDDKRYKSLIKKYY